MYSVPVEDAAKTDHGRSLGLDRGWRIAFKGCQLAFDIVQKSQDLPPTVPFFSMLQALRAVICCHTVGSHRLSVIPNLVDKRTRLIRIMGLLSRSVVTEHLPDDRSTPAYDE